MGRLREAHRDLHEKLAACAGELNKARGEQAATTEILRLISRSQGDALPVFQLVARSAAALCGSLFADVFRFDGESIDCVASHKAGSGLVKPLQFRYVMRPEMSRICAMLLSSKSVVRVEDAVGVPMLRDGKPLGAIVVGWTAARRVAPSEVSLLETFAEQAVLAIESMRLFNEAKEALEQHSATSEVLKVISRSVFELQPVLQSLLETAVTLCDADKGVIYRQDGEVYRMAVAYGDSPQFLRILERHPHRPGRQSATGRALVERRVIHIHDANADSEYTWAEHERGGEVRTVLAVPMLRESRVIGVFTIRRTQVRPFSEKQIELVTTFADQAIIAIENARLFDEIRDNSHQLELANAHKSRFLAAASHDLRQPLHALNLFVGQLQTEADPSERARLLARIEAAVDAMNEMFGALLDVSRLDAGVLEPSLVEFPVEQLLKRVETTFAESAREKGLRLRVLSSSAWVRSDFILLERMLFNLVSNAIRYTIRGGVLIGARPRGRQLRLDVWDTGAGVPESQRRNIFHEFYQVASPGSDHRAGLGLGLAIVERLGRLLDHPVDLASSLGRGSRFSVSVPRVAERRVPIDAAAPPAESVDPAIGKLIVVIDDDALVLDSVCGILRSWGCRAVPAASDTAAARRLRELGEQPDVIICDFRLADGKTGIEAIESLCAGLGVAVPAFLVSGDTAPERLREASASGYRLLHKPVAPITLRAQLNRILEDSDRGLARRR
jgi:signal transduction histidine kinase